jgi:hypothetical protein
LQARRSTDQVESWFFTTSLRVDQHLDLVDQSRTPRSRASLEDLLDDPGGEEEGPPGPVLRTARDYRTAVNRLLFDVPAPQYEAMVDALLRLRQPHLSERLEPNQLDTVLSDSLPPLDEDRLREVARLDSYWARLLGDVDAMSRAEGELWWWRYVNDTLFEAGQGCPAYHRTLYEDLARDPVAVTRGAYAFARIEWDADTEARVRSIASGAERIARAWKDELEPALVELVEKVLETSPMATWWSETEVARHVA